MHFAPSSAVFQQGLAATLAEFLQFRYNTFITPAKKYNKLAENYPVLNILFKNMLLGINSELENMIILSLSEVGTMTAEEILSTIQHKGKIITLQGLYRVLKKLQQERILTKEKHEFSLRLPWVIELGQFVEQLQRTYFNSTHLAQLLPTSTSQRRIWRFNNLLKMVEAWMQLVIAMAKNSEEKTIYTAAPHLWFALVNLQEWTQFKKALSSLIDNQFTLIQGTHFVDKYLNAVTKVAEEETYLNEESYIEEDLTIYKTIIDDIILTVRIDPMTAKKINTLFHQIKSEETMYLLDIFQAFTSKVRVTIMIKKDPIIAKRYKKKFVRVFGPVSKK